MTSIFASASNFDSGNKLAEASSKKDQSLTEAQRAVLHGKQAASKTVEAATEHAKAAVPSTGTMESGDSASNSLAQAVPTSVDDVKATVSSTHQQLMTTGKQQIVSAQSLISRRPKLITFLLLITSFLMGLFTSVALGGLITGAGLFASLRSETFKTSSGSPESHAHQMLDMQLKHHRQQHASMTDSWLPESLGGTSEASHKVHPKDLNKFIQQAIKTSGAGSKPSRIRGVRKFLPMLVPSSICPSFLCPSKSQRIGGRGSRRNSGGGGLSSYFTGESDDSDSYTTKAMKAAAPYAASKLMPSFMGGGQDDDDESSSWSSYVPGMKPKQQKASWTNWLTLGMIGRSGKPMKSKSSSSSGGLSSMIPSFMSHDDQDGLDAHDAKELQRLLHQSQRKVRKQPIHDDEY